MKSVYVYRNLVLAIIYLFVITPSFAQTTFSMQTNSGLKISGTSSLHDWDMVSNAGTGKATLILENNQIRAIKSLVAEVPAESIKSGKKGMDKNAYKALNTDQFKTIKFELKAAVLNKENEWTFTGNFIIAGVTKQAVFKVKSKMIAEVASFEGAYKFKLTDYGIQPPTALMGTVKTGDDVTISFNVAFK